RLVGGVRRRRHGRVGRLVGGRRRGAVRGGDGVVRIEAGRGRLVVHLGLDRRRLRHRRGRGIRVGDGGRAATALPRGGEVRQAALDPYDLQHAWLRCGAAFDADREQAEDERTVQRQRQRNRT